MDGSASSILEAPLSAKSTSSSASAAKNVNPRPLEVAREQGRRIQELVTKIEAVTDPNARVLSQECIQAILELYGTGLERILYLVEDAEARARSVFDTLTGDSIVGGLLLIHSLHPIPLETRVLKALEKVRPYMQSHGGNVELLSLEQGRAKLRLVGACDNCTSSAVTLELALRQAIEEACPDLAEFEVEGGASVASVIGSGAAFPNLEWVLLPEAGALQNGTFIRIKTARVPLILCRLDDQLYAYRDNCPSCNLPLHLGAIENGNLRCSDGHAFDVRKAGRSIENTKLHLDPFPLMTRNEGVMVAVG